MTEPFGTMFESGSSGREASPPLLAMAASMRVVRNYQLRNKTRQGATKTKKDDTFVTIVDRESGEAAMKHLRQLPNRYEIKAEDVDGRDNSSATNVILSDNVDGTNAMLIDLATSTVIIADYDKSKRQIVSCIIGEPVRATTWLATPQQATVRHQFKEDGSGVMEPKITSVWQGELSQKATIFLDISHGFARENGTRQVSTDATMARLFAELIPQTKILLPGSNGLMHALVANGGEGLAGGITTAMGGEWDAAGVYLVLRAGGVARAFRMSSDRKLIEADPLDPYAYDMVAFGNNERTVNKLVDALHASY